MNTATPSDQSEFLNKLNPDIRRVIESQARFTDTTPEVVMREVLREWAEHHRYVEMESA